MMVRMSPCRTVSSLVLVAPALAAVALQGAPQERDRAQVPDQDKWNLADIYPSEDAWRAAKTRITAGLPRLKTFEGALSTSPATLADAMDVLFSLDKELSRVYAYAGMLADQDTRDSAHQGMRQEMVQLASAFGAEAAFLEPEILRFPAGTVARFLAAEPRLKPYHFYLEDIARRASHTLTPAEEKILADAGPLAGAPSDIYTILTNADFPYPTITLSDGRQVTINQANYALYRASPTGRIARRRCRPSSRPLVASAGRSARP